MLLCGAHIRTTVFIPPASGSCWHPNPSPGTALMEGTTLSMFCPHFLRVVNIQLAVVAGVQRPDPLSQWRMTRNVHPGGKGGCCHWYVEPWQLLALTGCTILALWLVVNGVTGRPMKRNTLVITISQAFKRFRGKSNYKWNWMVGYNQHTGKRYERLGWLITNLWQNVKVRGRPWQHVRIETFSFTVARGHKRNLRHKSRT